MGNSFLAFTMSFNNVYYIMVVGEALNFVIVRIISHYCQVDAEIARIRGEFLITFFASAALLERTLPFAI